MKLPTIKELEKWAYEVEPANDAGCEREKLMEGAQYIIDLIEKGAPHGFISPDDGYKETLTIHREFSFPQNIVRPVRIVELSKDEDE